MNVIVEQAASISPDTLADLIAESRREGLRFVRRLADDWASGTNRFDRPGECFFTAQVDGRIVGVCGLNVDPYLIPSGHKDTSIGRVRRLYVAEAYRGQGVGRRLLAAVVSAAAEHFTLLRVRTENEAAGTLYESAGFKPVSDVADCTHVLDLQLAVTP